MRILCQLYALVYLEKGRMTEKTKSPRKPSILPISIRSAEQLGNAVRRLRKLEGLSQAALAQRSGITQATISRLEKGSQKAEIGTLILVFAALKADISISERPENGGKSDLEGLF